MIELFLSTLEFCLLLCWLHLKASYDELPEFEAHISPGSSPVEKAGRELVFSPKEKSLGSVLPDWVISLFMNCSL